MKLIRRWFWYVSIYFSRYKKLILATIFFSLFLATFIFYLWPKLPHPKPVIYLAVVGDYSPTNLPPLVEKIVKANFFNVNPNQTPSPNLIADIKTLEGGKVYLITLKKGLFWPDGHKLKSKDIALSIPQVKITYPQDDQIRFTLPEVFSPFPAVLSAPIINSQGQTPTGYTISITQSSSGELKTIQIEDVEKKIIIHTFSSQNQALTNFKLGKVDAIYGLKTQPEDLKTSNIKLEASTNHQAIVTLFINTKDPLLSDKNIRQAIAYLIKNKTQGETRAISPIHKNSWNYNPLTKDYKYNPEKGEKLLNQSLSAKKNKALNLEISTLPDFLSLADKIKKELEKHNINLTIRVANRPSANFQLFLGQFTIPVDPDQYTLWHSTQKTNITGLNSQKIDKLLEKGRTSIQQKERKKIYIEFQKVLAEELPAIFLYYPKSYNLIRGNINF